MNPTKEQIARIPEPFSEPQTIPAGWDVSAFDATENGKGDDKGAFKPHTDIDLYTKTHDGAQNTLQ